MSCGRGKDAQKQASLVIVLFLLYIVGCKKPSNITRKQLLY